MDWKVEVQTRAEYDLTLILDHLIEAYQSFGDDLREAFDRASHRVLAIRDSALALGSVPYRGTKREEFGPEIRNVTVNRAVIWFDFDAE
jgi:toxin ParE1/3/4